jgi:hypothetical protein
MGATDVRNSLHSLSISERLELIQGVSTALALQLNHRKEGHYLIRRRCFHERGNEATYRLRRVGVRNDGP